MVVTIVEGVPNTVNCVTLRTKKKDSFANGEIRTHEGCPTKITPEFR